MQITDNEIKEICSPTIYKRGLEYFKEGRVHLRSRKEDSISAAVDGEDSYSVHITFKDGKIKDTLCTCPYYTTMGCACKHIVAALKTRQAELNNSEAESNENDLLAAHLCEEYEKETPSYCSLEIAVRVITSTEPIYCSVALNVVKDDAVYKVSSVGGFADAMLGKGEYLLSKKFAASDKTCSFDGTASEIINILEEAHENKINSTRLFTQNESEFEIGSATLKRLIPLLKRTKCFYIIDNIRYSDLHIINDNPDILVDITAADKNINISVTESGTALTPDGALFLFENKIFVTDREWQSWFMPIYRAIILRKRTQLEFSGNNSIEFAAKVLPELKSRQGVVCYGLDELIVNEKPKFEIYLDRRGSGISAAVKALYGSVSIVLPSEICKSDKIIVRDEKAESDILLFFADFEQKGGLYILDDEESVFLFISEVIPVLEEYAELIFSDAFVRLGDAELPPINTSVRYNEKIDLLELEVESDLSEKELSEIFAAMNGGKRYYRFSSGDFLDFEKPHKSLDFLSALPFSGSVFKGRTAISKYYSLYLAEQARLGNAEADDSFLKMVDEGLSAHAKIPEYLNSVLRDYQKTGVHWLYQLSMLGLGGILADDMGLGKTLQVIAFIMSVKPQLPALIVAPSSLTYNWLNEISRFAPSAKAKIIDRTKEEREKAIRELDGLDFVITSYALLRRDIQNYREIDFSYCIIDEAQHIKNPQTMNARAVKKINAQRRFALTGTPIENSLSELWSIFDFVLSGYLMSRQKFAAKYEKNTDTNYSELRNKIKPFVLRRMKSDVLSELPEKIENTIYADFEPEQLNIYSAFLKAAREEARRVSEGGEGTMRILSLLTRLRQICCHPKLIDESYSKDSGKLKLLEELVTSALSAGHRVLIFSQFTSMLQIIRTRLDRLGIKSFYLDGSTPSYERTALADKFNGGEGQVFLISLKAGGTGLNLTGADTVIHYDPWWNPAVTDQASDRAHRIGQTRAVQVIKLAAANSIEEQILKLAERKRGLADGVIRENKNLLSALTRDELLSLFDE